MAALAGLLVSFLVFAAFAILTPDEDLVRGEGEVVWQRFQFEQERYSFTAGSEAVVANEGAVPLDLVVTGPGGGNRTFVIPAESTVIVNLTEEGEYGLRALTYSWGETTFEVRSANPFVRFFEDLF